LAFLDINWVFILSGNMVVERLKGTRERKKENESCVENL